MKDRILIPISEIEIKYDPDKTTAYDFTIEDYFTFCTHDGIFVQDSMAVYLPVTEESQAEAKSQALSTNCLLNPTDMKITTTPSQEMVLGLYMLSTIEEGKYAEKVLYKGDEITEGMKIINECFPENFPLINKPITSDVIRQYIYDAFNLYDGDIKNILDNIKTVGFVYATLIGHTISLKGMLSQTKLRDEIYAMPKVTDQIKAITGERVSKFLKENFEYTEMIESGARGSWDQARQLILSRGFISNFKGNILTSPIKNSFVDGLTPEEFFTSSFGCRKGLLDVAVKTSFSGYLFRKFTFACSNLMLDHDNEDCGTDHYISIYITDIKKARSVNGRWVTFDPKDHKSLFMVAPSNMDKIIGKKIFMRSPMYCKTEKVCKKCYGELYRHLNNSRFIGSIAAQALGESNTQMVLRTFHSSVFLDTNIIDVNNNNYTIEEVYNKVKTGEDFYTFSCSPEGDIEVSKVIDAHRDRMEKTVLKITLDNGEYIKCSLDHQWMKRDGSYPRADELKIGDSLMPIYFKTSYDGYRTIKQNNKSPHSRQFRHDRIYKLSSQHSDTIIHENLKENDIKHHHHVDKNKLNDYPTNIMILNNKDHLNFHRVDISESNKRRCKDPEFVKKFSETRRKTMEENNTIEQMNASRELFFKNNPDHGKNCFAKARLTMIKNNIDKMIKCGTELTNDNYNEIRSTEKCPLFDFVKENYPELVEDFIIVAPKSKDHLHADARVVKIKQKMIDENLEFTDDNFNKANEMLYPDARFRWSMKVIEKHSPNCLDFLNGHVYVPVIEKIKKPISKARLTQIKTTIATMKEQNIELTNNNFDNMKLYGRSPKFKYVMENVPELVDDFTIIPPKSSSQKYADKRVGQIKQEMIEKGMEFTIDNFDKTNEILYPDTKFRRDISILEKHSPECLSFLNDNQYNHKIINIEIIEYDEEQNLYDLTVDSKYPNFATKAGVFIHNSGVASIDEDSINEETGEMEQKDIVGALALISKLVHIYEKNKNADDLVSDLFEIYSKDRFFMHVHFECLVAQLMWYNDKHKWRTIENRHEKPYQMKSIVSIPSLESWIMGISFSNTKKELINSLLQSGIYSGGVIDKIMCGVSYKNI